MTVLKMLCAVLVFLAAGCSEPAHSGAAEHPFLELRIGHTTPQVGFWRATYNGIDVYLTPWSIFDDSGIESLALERRGSELLLTTRLFPGAAGHLADITRRNIGNELAVLVHGEVRGLATIQSPFAGKHAPLQIALSLKDGEAHDFVRAARARWPARQRSRHGLEEDIW